MADNVQKPFRTGVQQQPDEVTTVHIGTPQRPNAETAHKVDTGLWEYGDETSENTVSSPYCGQ
jgi:hypothetical protein